MTSRRRFLKTSTVSVLGGALASSVGFPPVSSAAPTGSRTDEKVALTPRGPDNTFDFETAQIKGSICLDGSYHGVTRLTDKRTGRQVIDERYSALNLFRLFSVNQGMGQPRTMDRTVEVSPHSVEAKWAATDAYQGEITARYEVCGPNAVDVTVSVQCRGTYPGYELFMSSYFDKSFEPHVYLQRRARGRLPVEADLVLPTVNDVFRGTVLVFPRDAHAARRCVDGRWDRSEWKSPTVQMCPVRRYAHCLAFMADPKKQLGVVLMSRPSDCYAISTRYHAKDEADRLTTYSAFDLSLFGDDLLPGDCRTVKVRLALTELDADLTQPLELHRQFLSELDRQNNEEPRKAEISNHSFS